MNNLKNHSKLGLLILMLALAIGFAAVTTTLIVNGTSRVGSNSTDFDVYFSAASTDQGGTAIIDSTTRRGITFSTKSLKNVGDSAVLNYTVTNDSSQYDANVTVSFQDTSATSHSSYYTITKEVFSETNENPTSVPGRTSKDGRITITLNKASTENITDTFTLTLNVSAVERTSEAGFATISGVATDNNNNVLSNTPLAVFSTPQVITTDANGHYEVRLPVGQHHVYYIPGLTANELTALGENAQTDYRAQGVEVNVTTNDNNKNLAFTGVASHSIGDVVSIGDQEFYYIGTEDNKMKLLAKYNLNIKDSGSSTSYQLVNATQGVQNPIAGTLKQEGVWYARVAFDDSNGMDTVYGPNATIYNHAQNYKSVLANTYGVNVTNVRLLTKDDLSSLFGTTVQSGNSLVSYCSDTTYTTCSNTQENGYVRKLGFLFTTSYWAYDPNANSDYDDKQIAIIGGDDVNNPQDGGLLGVYIRYHLGFRPVVIV